jgi:uroporphyrinogen decarboxylase
LSLNDGVIIRDEASFNAYKWPEPGNFDYSRLEKIEPYLPEGMKVMVMGPGNVGKRLLDYYEISAAYNSVGFLMANDDWGFKTQPFLSPAQMREYVFPWHKKIVRAVHAHKKPIILHSCGYLNMEWAHSGYWRHRHGFYRPPKSGGYNHSQQSHA